MPPTDPNRHPAPVGRTPAFAQTLLTACAATSLAIGLLHVACIFTGETTARFFSAPTPVIELIRQKSLLLIPICLGIAAVFGIFSLYAWSGAGRFRRMPFLRAGLTLIGSIYTLRGLLLVPQVLFACQHPGRLPWQIFLFSLVSLLLGLAHLVGIVGRWQELGTKSGVPEQPQ